VPVNGRLRCGGVHGQRRGDGGDARGRALDPCRQLGDPARATAPRDEGGVPLRGAAAVQLTGVSCAAPSFCTAVGYFTAAGIDVALAERWDGTRWAIGHARYPRGALAARFSDVSCPSSRACTAVGLRVATSGLDAPLAERWTARGWAVQPTPALGSATAPVDASLSGVSCLAPARCEAAGDMTPPTGIEGALVEAYGTR
jgi:hypothetical protein